MGENDSGRKRKRKINYNTLLGDGGGEKVRWVSGEYPPRMKVGDDDDGIM